MSNGGDDQGKKTFKRTTSVEKWISVWEYDKKKAFPPCPEGSDQKEPIHEEKDKAGNKFQVFCRNGQYEGVYTPKGGNPVYVGKCMFPWGQNAILKKINVDVEVTVTVDDDGKETKVEGEPSLPENKIEKIFWKNMNPNGAPPKEGKEGPKVEGASDILWIFDPVENELTIQKTKHSGHWELDKKEKPEDPEPDPKKPENWGWAPEKDEPDGAPEKKKAPATSEELGMRVAGPHPFCSVGVSMPLAMASVAPFTVTDDDGRPYTYATVMLTGSDELQFRSVEATAGKMFTFEMSLPFKEDRLYRFALLAAPKGMTITRQTGVIRWRPTKGQVGEHNVAVVHQCHTLTPHVDEFVLRVRRR